MSNHRIHDDEAAALLRGDVPPRRADLAGVADAVAAFRLAAGQAAPQPSAELLARLDADRVAAGSISFDPNATTAATSQTPSGSSPKIRRRRVAFTGIAGLGLAAKIAIGAAAATAAGLTGVGAAGAAGVLPAPAQEVFDGVTGQQEPGGEHISDTGREHREFGQQTAEDAREKGADRRDAAHENAEEKRRAGLDKAAEHRQNGDAPVVPGDEASETGQQAAEDGAANGEEHSQTGQETADDAASAGEERSGDGQSTADDARDGAPTPER
ncbi:hypothetical protein ACFWGP_02405 [Agromyces sp. NPDC127015]|uniref:hypothetical protein n=1 Tax=Agromyces sp. NPDC127015 TaxID=3347108 RepID=UPI00364F5C35